MNVKKRTVAAIGSAVLVLAAGSGLAAAAARNSGPGGGPGPGPVGQAVTGYLGLSASDLRTQLQSGKTLADVAAAQGKSVSGLEDAIVADAKTHLDAEVAAGDLTAAQESSMVSDLQSHVADIVNRTGPPPGGGPGHGPFDVSAITTYLGIGATELKSDLDSGQTLADVATAQGKSVSGLEDAIVAAAKTHLDADVVAGSLTAAQESTRLSDLQAHVADLVTHTGPPPGGQGGPGFAPRRSA
jgi:hypothetical protein